MTGAVSFPEDPLKSTVYLSRCSCVCGACSPALKVQILGFLHTLFSSALALAIENQKFPLLKAVILKPTKVCVFLSVTTVNNLQDCHTHPGPTLKNKELTRDA